jgi:CubicO group peptidase (beta-lactamase class C family)
VKDPLPRALGLALVAVAFVACAPAKTRRPPEHKIDRVFAEYSRSDSPGCAVGVIRDGAFVFRKGYGMASLELGVPNDTDTVFYVGSVSKQFVAASVALAARQGHLSLDDDIRRHLPEIPGYGTPITVRDLVHHTSGLRDYLALMWMAGMRYEDVHTDEELVALVARQEALNFEPGDEFLYSNSGYFLLAEIVKRATGQSLREFARENIFGPLGMTHTRFHDDRTEVVPHRAMAYESDGDGYRLLWYLNFDKVGSGGLLTTVEDLLLWDRAFYSDPLADGGLVEELLQRGGLNDGTVLDYAFGLRHGEHRGLRTIDHAGAFMGFRAQLLRFPDERVSVVALCNLASSEPDRLARRVADIVLADVFTEPPSRGPAKAAPGSGTAAADDGAREEPTAEALKACEGRYFSNELQATYTLAVSEGSLTLQRGRLEPVALEAHGRDEFEAEDLRLVFEGRDRESPTGLAAHAGRVRNIRFERVGD